MHECMDLIVFLSLKNTHTETNLRHPSKVSVVNICLAAEHFLPIQAIREESVIIEVLCTFLVKETGRRQISSPYTSPQHHHIQTLPTETKVD